MNFDQRKQVAEEMVLDFLRQFSAPRGIDDAGQAKQVRSIADAFARKMPVTPEPEYRMAIEGVFSTVRDGHSSYAWPTQGAFVEAMPKGVASGLRAPQTFQGTLEDLAKKMRNGDPVPEGAAWGMDADRLRSEGRVGYDVIMGYRAGSIQAAGDAYRSRADEWLEERYGKARVDETRQWMAG